MPVLKTRNPWRLAQERVRRGVRFLNKHAPIDWERRMFHVDGRYARIRARCDRDTECHLALAFCVDPSVARPEDGRVTCASVAHAYGLSEGMLIALGFDLSGRQSEHPTIRYKEILDEAWKVALTTYAKPRLTPTPHYVHPAPTARSTTLSEHSTRGECHTRRHVLRKKFLNGVAIFCCLGFIQSVARYYLF